MSHALTEQPHALSGAISCQIVAHVSQETIPRAAAHISTAVAASAPTAPLLGRVPERLPAPGAWLRSLAPVTPLAIAPAAPSAAPFSMLAVGRMS